MSRIDSWFGADAEWERPRPERGNDVQIALASAVIITLGAELVRSMGAFEDEPHGIGWQYVAMLSLVALVPFRRTHPLTITMLAGAHLFVASITVPMTISTLPTQAVYFFLFFSGVAWARDRRLLIAVLALVLTFMIAWLAWVFALGQGMQELVAALTEDLPEQIGFFDVMTALALNTVLVNVLFFGGAIVLGQIAWNGARRTAQVVGQARTIREQAGRLRDQAVVAERLRIARELHDVVAHHVSLMGVQAAAARRVMDRDPEAAREALGAVEQSSREAVGQMRGLLGTLRTGEIEAGSAVEEGPGMPSIAGEGAGGRAAAQAQAVTGEAEVADRSPQPTLADLPALATQATTPTCAATVSIVESAPGAAGRVPPPVQLSAYRVVQEALANSRRHSTSRHANAVVRIDEDANRLEVEVVDDGTPRVGTSGTGLGLLGMWERAERLGGTVEAGPRRGRPGWRVLVRLPVDGRRSAESPSAGFPSADFSSADFPSADLPSADPRPAGSAPATTLGPTPTSGAGPSTSSEVARADA